MVRTAILKIDDADSSSATPNQFENNIGNLRKQVKTDKIFRQESQGL